MNDAIVDFGCRASIEWFLERFKTERLKEKISWDVKQVFLNNLQ